MVIKMCYTPFLCKNDWQNNLFDGIIISFKNIAIQAYNWKQPKRYVYLDTLQLYIQFWVYNGKLINFMLNSVFQTALCRDPYTRHLDVVDG